MRKYFLDNIRWATVILVLVYHVFYLYNSVGVFGGIGGFSEVQYQDGFLCFVYPWFMALLFLIAGISSRYALQKRTHKEFIKDKTAKLLVPSTLGLFVYHFVGGYLNIKFGGGLEYMPDFLVYPISVLSGVGPLWFIQLLYVFSLLLVLIRKIDSKEKLYRLCAKSNLLVVVLLVFPVFLSAQILNAPVITTYRFGIYFMVYLLGYFVFSHDEVQEKLEKYRFWFLVPAVVLAVFYVIFNFNTDYTASGLLRSLFTNVYLWFAILAILGCGRAWCNKTNRFANYMSKTSFGVYVVHYSITLVVCYLLKTYLPVPPAVIYVLAIVFIMGLSFGVYELLRRIPVIRYLMFGIRGKKREKVGSSDVAGTVK